MNIKHPISVLTLTLTPFFIATGCSSTGGQHPTSLAATSTATSVSTSTPSTTQHINTESKPSINETSTIDPSNNNLATTDITTKAVTDTVTDELEMLGVLDSEAPPETTINNNPRPAKHIFQFGFNKAELSDEEKTIIQDHGQFLASHPSQSIVVHGHSDSQGDQNYNQFLSEKRAQHVAALLKKAGASKGQIEIFSWSSTSPADVATNYKVNRRVELHYGQDYFAKKAQ